MPTYEYACRDCGEHVEVVQSFRDDPLTTCGICQGRLRKVFSAAGIIFKGDGYYVTDSRKKDKAAAASAASASSAPSEDSAASGGSKDSASGGATDSSTSSSGSGAVAESA